MKKTIARTFGSIAVLLAVSACASKPVQREPSSIPVLSNVGKIQSVIPEGEHRGYTADKTPCRVYARYAVEEGGVPSVLITGSDAKFDQSNEKKGSTESMGAQAAFKYWERAGVAPEAFELTRAILRVSVKRPGGGPELQVAKRMTLQVTPGFSGKIEVTITETTGLMYSGKRTLNCII